MTKANRTLMIEFDGESVAPDNLEPLAALAFAHAYLVLLQELAEKRGKTLQFTGLTVKDKCAALATEVSSVTTADRASAEAGRLLATPDSVPPDLAKGVRTVIAARAALPPYYRVAVITPRRRRSLGVAEWPAPTSGNQNLHEVVSVRARVTGIQGKTPRVYFDTVTEERVFHLKATRSTAKAIAPHLYDEVDILALLERDASLRIVGGELKEFFPLSSEKPVETWDEWYANNDQEWSRVEDIDKELGKDGSQETSQESPH